MKARRKGTDNPFREIEMASIKDIEGLYLAEELEFEQPTSDHWQAVREMAAIMAFPSIIPMQKGLYSICNAYKKYDDCANEAIAYADTLVKKLKGE